MVLGQWISTCKRRRLTPYTKINNSEWIKDLNVRAKTIKLLEENLSMNLCDLKSHSGFSDITPKSKPTKENSKLCSKIRSQKT